MELLASSSSGYQIMNRSRHTVLKYLHEEKTHVAIDSKFLKNLDHVHTFLDQVDSTREQVEH